MAIGDDAKLRSILEKVELLTGERSKGSRRAVLISELDGLIQDLSDQNASIKKSVKELEAQFNSNSAYFNEEILVRADENSALTQVITTLKAVVEKNEAQIQETRRALATKTMSLAEHISTLSAQVGDSRANISEEKRVRASNDDAEALLRSNLSAYVGYTNGQSYTKTLAASISDEAIARANKDSSLAQKVTYLNAGSNRVYAQTDAPGNTSGQPGYPRQSGDVWYDTDDDFKPYVWAQVNDTGAYDWRDNSSGIYTKYIGQFASVLNKIKTLTTNDISYANTTTTLTSTLDTQTANIGTQYTVYSRGSAAPAGNAGLYVGTSATPTNAAVRSYNVYAIKKSDGTVTFNSYDVYADAANATAMAAKLNSYDNSYVVVVCAFDEPQTNRLLNGLPDAMYRCGASRLVFGDSSNFKYRSAYILVGVPGGGEGSGTERYAGVADSDTGSACSFSFSIRNGQPQGIAGTGVVTLAQSLTTTATKTDNLTYEYRLQGSFGTTTLSDGSSFTGIQFTGGRQRTGTNADGTPIYSTASNILLAANTIKLDGNVIITGSVNATQIASAAISDSDVGFGNGSASVWVTANHANDVFLAVATYAGGDSTAIVGGSGTLQIKKSGSNIGTGAPINGFATGGYAQTYVGGTGYFNGVLYLNFTTASASTVAKTTAGVTGGINFTVTTGLSAPVALYVMRLSR